MPEIGFTCDVLDAFAERSLEEVLDKRDSRRNSRILGPEKREAGQKLTKPIKVERLDLLLIEDQMQVRGRDLVDDPLLLEEGQHLFVEELQHLEVRLVERRLPQQSTFCQSSRPNSWGKCPRS